MTTTYATYDAYIAATSHTAEISILARELRAASFGALTQREAIARARAIVAADAPIMERLIAA